MQIRNVLDRLNVLIKQQMPLINCVVLDGENKKVIFRTVNGDLPMSVREQGNDIVFYNGRIEYYVPKEELLGKPN